MDMYKIMKRKFNKEQLKAIETLIFDINELENKPRRLFYALESFAFAFNKEDSVPSIREAQDLMYSHINEGYTYSELFTSLRKYTIDEWKRQVKHSPDDLSYSENMIQGANDFVRKHIRRLTDTRFN